MSQSKCRQALAAAISERNEIRASMAEIQAALDRLAAARSVDARPAADLAALDAAEASAALEWAQRSDAGDAPVPDVERRAEIEAALAVAKAASQAAARAVPALESRNVAAAARLAAADRGVALAAMQALLDDLSGQLDEHRRHTAALARTAAKIEGARDIIIDGARRLSDGNSEIGRSVYAAVETFDRARAAASPDVVQMADARKAEATKWSAHLACLAHDAGAVLEAA